MLNPFRLHPAPLIALGTCLFFSISACKQDESTDRNGPDATVLLVIDEDCIDNGNPPNNFSETDVNDPLAEFGLRLPLQFFKENLGNSIDLYTGEVGDEGWHALKTIPASWISAGPMGVGSQNFLAAGFGEDLLDKTPDVVPLRATGLKMLIGKTILAIVYDSDISTNYSPLNANLMGANLGLVALEVLEVTERTDGSTSSLPKVKVFVHSVEEALLVPLMLFSNAPVPQSSSEPFDVAPPSAVAAAVLVAAP